MTNALHALEEWYAAELISVAQYQALAMWREDGGGIRKRGRPPKAQAERQQAADVMPSAAHDRHRSAHKAMERIGDNVAKAVHRLVMLDDGDQRVEPVQQGAAVVWACYFARG